MTAPAPLAGAVPYGVALVLGAALALAACGPTPDAPAPGAPTPDAPASDPVPFASEADYRQQRADAAQALEAAVETEAGSVGACRVVATGEQACGGPSSFAVYSAEASDAAEVERLAARLVALDTRTNRQFELVSTCRALVPPTPSLRDGRCVAGR